MQKIPPAWLEHPLDSAPLDTPVLVLVRRRARSDFVRRIAKRFPQGWLCDVSSHALDRQEPYEFVVGWVPLPPVQVQQETA